MTSKAKKTTATTKTTATPGRDKNGRFTDGNKFSRGRRIGAKIRTLRRDMVEAIDRTTFRQFIRSLLNQAIAGDMIAAKLILDRLFGTPAESIEDLEEKQFAKLKAIDHRNHDILKTIDLDYDPVTSKADYLPENDEMGNDLESIEEPTPDPLDNIL